MCLWSHCVKIARAHASVSIVNVNTIAVPTTVISTREVTKTFVFSSSRTSWHTERLCRQVVVLTSDESRITSTMISTVVETAQIVMTQTMFETSTAQTTVVRGTTQAVTVQTTDYDVHVTTQKVWVPQTQTVTKALPTVVTIDGQPTTSVVK